MVYLCKMNVRSNVWSCKTVMKSDDKREIIFEAILISIAKYGLNAPMSKIVKESGISTGVFYHYFKNKETMIEELYKKSKYNFLEATLCDYDKKHKYYDQFCKIWMNSINYFITHPNVLKLFWQFENAPHLLPQLEAMHVEKINIFIKFIEKGIKKGIVKDLPLIVISDLTIGAGMQMAKNVINGTIILENNLIEDLMAASWDSIKK